MVRKIISFVFASCCLGLSVLANATTIIDTGSATLSANGAVSLFNNPIGNQSAGSAYYQSLGAGFSITDSYRITDISSYFYTVTAGTLTASLYADNFGLPGNQLYSQSFLITSTSGVKSWAGVSDLDWLVSSGNYWLTYEVLNGQTFNGALEFPAVRPLQMIFKNDLPNEWNYLGTVNDSFALVVSGDSISPVPIPGSYGMMLTGIGVLGFMARRKKNSAA